MDHPKTRKPGLRSAAEAAATGSTEVAINIAPERAARASAGGEADATREQAAHDRDAAALVRETSVQLREDAASLQQETFDAREVTFDAREDTFDAREESFDARENTFDAREVTFDRREDTFDAREVSFDAREVTFDAREVTFDAREVTFDAREEAARVKTELQAPVMAQLREANEHLIMATVHAQNMTDASERANRQREQFLAMLAHELRNPLAPIVNALAILRSIPTVDPLAPWAHDIIKRQIDHMTRLLDDLLDVARVTSGKIMLEKCPITVSDVMLQAIETSRPRIDERKQHLKIAMPAQPLVVDGDLERLVQVFSNLLNNASKYTQEGGAITFSGEQQADAVVLSVVDNGFGIAAEALPGIFDLFTQEERSLALAHGGLGIGLTIVRTIAEMHGGTVTARSAGPGKGSEFTVTLPRVLAPCDAVAPPAEVAPAPTPMAYRIVLIDDNADACESLKTLLELYGCHVATALDGLAGAKLVQTERPHIVLCDIGLPGMDGYAVLERVRADFTPPLPLMVALTGYGSHEDRARALAAGFDHHLVKPVSADVLLRLIDQDPRRIS